MKLHRWNSIEERFWGRIEKTENCWNWLGTRSAGRYGSLRVNGRAVKAHRYMWQLTYGEIPSGVEVCHTCDNGLCVNPAHLFLGTHSDNMRDMASKGRSKVIPMPGEKNPMSKLTARHVLEIRSRYFSDAPHTKAYRGPNSASKIAAQYGVTKGCIDQITSGKVWT